MSKPIGTNDMSVGETNQKGRNVRESKSEKQELQRDPFRPVKIGMERYIFKFSGLKNQRIKHNMLMSS